MHEKSVLVKFGITTQFKYCTSSFCTIVVDAGTIDINNNRQYISFCTKTKVKFPGYEGCPKALETSFGARLCAVGTRVSQTQV